MKEVCHTSVQLYYIVCKKPFRFQRALSVHLTKSSFCMEFKGNHNQIKYNTYKNIQSTIHFNNLNHLSNLIHTNTSTNTLNDTMNFDQNILCNTDNITTPCLGETINDTSNHKIGNICKNNS